MIAQPAIAVAKQILPAQQVAYAQPLAYSQPLLQGYSQPALLAKSAAYVH